MRVWRHYNNTIILLIIMAEMAIMLSGLATSNEGDAYTWSVICCLIINEFRIYNIYSIFSGK